MEQGIGARYQRETAYSRASLKGGSQDWANQPETYKRYPQATRTELEQPDPRGGAPLWRVLATRRSVRDYSDTPLRLGEVSQLLWASTGITLSAEGYGLRTAPSAGGLYPIETYLSVQAEGELPSGLYHYDIAGHALELLRPGDHRSQVAHAALDQPLAYRAPLVVLWSAVFARTTWKYRDRGYRYVYMEAGHVAQNLALAALGLGLVTCQIAAIFDDEANALLDVDGREESVIYMSIVGHEA